MLWVENLASLAYRYPDSPPEEWGFEKYTHRHNPNRHPTPIQTIKACDCLDYQSCEHPEWPASEAKAFLDALRAMAWTRLPGYEDAEWGIA